MSQIVSGEQMTLTVDSMVDFFKENIPGILIVVGFIIGLSIVAAIVETLNDQRQMSKRRHF